MFAYVSAALARPARKVKKLMGISRPSSSCAGITREDMCTWSVAEVGEWLHHTGISALTVGFFAGRGIDGNTLLHLTLNELMCMQLPCEDVGRICAYLAKISIQHVGVPAVVAAHNTQRHAASKPLLSARNKTCMVVGTVTPKMNATVAEHEDVVDVSMPDVKELVAEEENAATQSVEMHEDVHLIRPRCKKSVRHVQRTGAIKEDGQPVVTHVEPLCISAKRVPHSAAMEDSPHSDYFSVPKPQRRSSRRRERRGRAARIHTSTKTQTQRHSSREKAKRSGFVRVKRMMDLDDEEMMPDEVLTHTTGHKRVPVATAAVPPRAVVSEQYKVASMRILSDEQKSVATSALRLKMMNEYSQHLDCLHEPAVS